MELFKIQAVLYLSMILFAFWRTDAKDECTLTQFAKLLSRRKRFLVFPDGSSFAVKRSFSKAIIDNIPKGMNLNVDCGIYYPLPGSKDPWNPAKLLYRLELARTGGLSATPKPKAKPKIDEDVSNWTTDNNVGVLNASSYFPAKYRWDVNQKMKWPIRKMYSAGPSPSSWDNGLRRKDKPILSNQWYNTSRTKPIKFYSNRPKYVPLSPALTRGTFKQYKPKITFENATWRNYREYRERREIYATSEHLGSIFGINMKACMLRAICEMNEDFLPAGRSLILDTARILFDLPTDNEFEDDYGDIAREKNIDCARKFLVSCPYSPMKFLSRSLRLSKSSEHNSIKKSFT